jgi:hypothetical protein
MLQAVVNTIEVDSSQRSLAKVFAELEHRRVLFDIATMEPLGKQITVEDDQGESEGVRQEN